MPIVSVIMPVYNEKEYMIEEAIDSVRNQSFHDWELIIICDNPHDSIMHDYLRRYVDDQVKVIINQKNLGSALTRNVGVEHAYGEYIAFLDADDVCSCDRLKKQLIYIRSYSYDMVCSGRHLIDEQGNIIKEFEPGMTEQKIQKYLPYINYVYNSSVLIKRQVLLELGGYRNYPGGHDYDLWMRVLYGGYKIGYVDEDLLGYRMRDFSITSSSSYLQTIDCAYIRVLFRRKKIMEPFNVGEYKKHSNRYLKSEKQVVRNYDRSVKYRRKFAENLSKKKPICALVDYVIAVAGSRVYRLNITNSIRMKFFLHRK